MSASFEEHGYSRSRGSCGSPSSNCGTRSARCPFRRQSVNSARRWAILRARPEIRERAGWQGLAGTRRPVFHAPVQLRLSRTRGVSLLPPRAPGRRAFAVRRRLTTHSAFFGLLPSFPRSTLCGTTLISSCKPACSMRRNTRPSARFIGLAFVHAGRYVALAAEALRWGWDRWDSPAGGRVPRVPPGACCILPIQSRRIRQFAPLVAQISRRFCRDPLSR